MCTSEACTRIYLRTTELSSNSASAGAPTNQPTNLRDVYDAPELLAVSAGDVGGHAHQLLLHHLSDTQQHNAEAQGKEVLNALQGVVEGSLIRRGAKAAGFLETH